MQGFLRSDFPWKLIRSRTAIEDGIIRPAHIKLYPTNRCNAACSYCTFKKRSRAEELSTAELLEIAGHFQALGARAITLVGGGEPTMHPGLPAFLKRCREVEVQVGLTTNGLIYTRQEKILQENGYLVWVRLSVPELAEDGSAPKRVKLLAANLPDVDLGVSLVVTGRQSLETVRPIAETVEKLANVHYFRLVEDVASGAAEKLQSLAAELAAFSKTVCVRADFNTARPWQGPCLVSKLRPNIAADGYVYPCCYADGAGGREALTFDLPPEFRMAHWRDFNLDTPPFEARCAHCHLRLENEILAGLLSPMAHECFL